MGHCRGLITLLAAGVMIDASGCTPAAEKQAEDVSQKIEDKVKDVAEEAADKTKEIVTATGEKITDGWITAKITAKFADDKELKESKIDVDTNDRIVTLKGTVVSNAAKTRAASIASGTEGVTSVVNELKVGK
jgi:hyperosmotically inducible protein